MREFIVICALFGLLIGSPAAAIESVSGSYEAKLRCKGLQGGDFVKAKSDATIGIFDNGAGELVFDVSDLGTLEGFVLGSMRKPETGTLSGVTCGLSAASGQGATLHAEVKVKAGAGKASFKGTLVLMDEGASIASICQVKAKRVSDLTPKLLNCPM